MIAVKKAGVINLETALRLRDIDALKVAKSIEDRLYAFCKKLTGLLR